MAKKKTQYISKEGLLKLQQELEYLKTVRVSEIAARLKEALSFGDLKENADYQSAREEELLNDARIRAVEEEIMNSELFDEEHIKTGYVELGSKVKIKNITEGNEEMTFTIVGSTEVDPMDFKFSNESAIGEAVIGKKVGETTKFMAPSGEKEVLILSVD